MKPFRTNPPALFILLVLIFMSQGKSSAQEVIKIMPLGNSITVGYTDGTLPVNLQTSYRFALHYQLEQAGYLFDFVGSESSGCVYFSDCQHAGINGQRDQFLVRLLTDGYDERWDRQIINPPGPYLDVYNPDIILLHIGTNDITHETNPGTTQVSAILDLIDAYEARANKEVTVFLALIINRMIGAPKRTETSNFNNQIKAMAQARINSGDKIVIVDMEHDAGLLYTSTDMTDELHPNDIGYTKMGGLWFQKINAFFNQAPVIDPIPDQVVPEGQEFAAINLNDYVSDKETPDLDLVWTIIPEDPEYFDISFDANRVCTIVPVDSNWNGSETIVFKVADRGVNGGFIKYDTDTVIFTVTPVEDAPLFTSIPYIKGKEDSLYAYTATAFDPEQQPVTLSAPVLPSWLSFDPSTGKLTGKPGNDHTGDNPVTLEASDGVLSTKQVFTIEVINVNNTPVIVGMTKSVKTALNTPVDIALTDLLVQDPDNLFPEDFSLHLNEGDHYTVSGNTVIPDAEYIGTLQVQTRVNDGFDYSPYSYINVQVNQFSALGDDPNDETVIQVYPNPASKLINIVLPRPVASQVRIFNQLGVNLYNEAFSNRTHITIDNNTNWLSPGIYLYQVIFGDKTCNGKLVIK